MSAQLFQLAADLTRQQFAPRLPLQDPTERAFQEVAEVCEDLRSALASAASIGRVRQLHARTVACLEMLTAVEEELIDVLDANGGV